MEAKKGNYPSFRTVRSKINLHILWRPTSAQCVSKLLRSKLTSALYSIVSEECGGLCSAMFGAEASSLFGNESSSLFGDESCAL